MPAVVRLIHELADYERLPHLCHATDQLLAEALFADRPHLFGHVAVADRPAPASGGHPGTDPGAQEVVGYALWFLSYSTWEGVHGIYLEDLYVRPQERGTGLGKALLSTLARIAAERGYARVEWSVLDWNAPSIDFYSSLGAVPMDGWTTFRLSGPALARTAAESS